MAQQRFRYNPGQPIENQLQTFLNGRNPYGTIGNADWQDVNNPKYYSSQMSAPDESGTTNLQYQSINPDVTYHPGADSPYGLYNDQFGAINWRPTDNPNGIKSPDGVTGYVKPDDMYDYNNLYYDDKYGLVKDIRDYRDPNAKQNGWIDAAIMAAVGGVGGMAASAANAAAGGASFMGVQAPSLARTGLSAISSLNNAANLGERSTGGPNAAARTNYGGSNMAVTNNPLGSAAGLAPVVGALGNVLKDGGTDDPNGQKFNTGGDGTDNGEGNGNDLFGVLGNLLTTGATGYATNKTNQNYRGDINNMLTIGTGGVTPDDRAGARGLVKGVYDGSISGDQILNRVPGLAAISQRGYDDIARHMSAQGDADPQSSARMREFAQFNNELTSKAYDQEMNRAASIGGYNINPSAVAGKGIDAVTRINSNQRQDLSSLASLLSGANGGKAAGGAIGGLLQAIAKGGSGASSALRQLFSGLGSSSTGIDWSGTDGYYEPGTADYIQQQTDNYMMNDPTQNMNYAPPIPDINYQDYPDLSQLPDYF
jgi:hypothetical protein